MPVINQQTKEKILQAAEIVFHENGFKGARTTQIAQKAGISRTMLHYYYHTKEALFQEVLVLSFGHFIQHAQALLEEATDLKSLLEKIIDVLYAIMEEKPSLPSFIVNISNESPELLTSLPLFQEEQMPDLLDKLIEEARFKGQIQSPITGENVLLNIYGLCAIPFLTAPLIQFKENRDAAAMQAFTRERKAMIKSFVWNGLKGK